MRISLMKAIYARSRITEAVLNACNAARRFSRRHCSITRAIRTASSATRLASASRAYVIAEAAQLSRQYGFGGTSVAKSYTDRFSPSPRSSPVSSPAKPTFSPALSNQGSPLKATHADDDDDEWAPKKPVLSQPDFVSRRPFAAPSSAAAVERTTSTSSGTLERTQSSTSNGSGQLAPPVSRSLSNRTPSPAGSAGATPDLGRLSLSDGPDVCPRCAKTVYFGACAVCPMF